MAGAKGIVVDLVANVAGFLRGTKDAEKALDDVDHSLDDLARGGEQAAKKIEQSFSDSFHELRVDADKAGHDVGNELHRNARAKEVGSEVGSEFAQNFGEGIRGGNIGGSVFETLTSLAPALGALGIGVAVGAGFVNQIIQGANEKKAQITAMASDLFTTLRDGFLDQAGKENLVEKALGVDTIDAAYRKVAELSRLTGIAAGDIFEAISSGGTAQTGVTAKIVEGKAELAKTRVEVGGLTEDLGKQEQAYGRIFSAQQQVAAANVQAAKALNTELLITQQQVAEVLKLRGAAAGTIRAEQADIAAARTRARP